MEEIMIIIKKESDDFLAKMGFAGDSVVVADGKTVIVNYQTDDAALLIGKGGEVLDALQHILKIVLADTLYSEGRDLVVDICGYRDKKASQLAKKARERAYQVLATGIEEIFPPMSSYERMIIHTTCSNIADVETESQGSGRERRVVIKPKRS